MHFFIGDITSLPETESDPSGEKKNADGKTLSGIILSVSGNRPLTLKSSLERSACYASQGQGAHCINALTVHPVSFQ